MNTKTFKKLLKTEKWRFTVIKEGWGDMEFLYTFKPKDTVTLVEQKIASMFDPSIPNHHIHIMFKSGKVRKLEELESFIPVLESLGKDEDIKNLKEVIEKLNVMTTQK